LVPDKLNIKFTCVKFRLSQQICVSQMFGIVKVTSFKSMVHAYN